MRQHVAQAVRRAAALIYTQAAQPMTFAWLAAELDSEAVSPELLEQWAEEDGWEHRRNEVAAARAAAEPGARATKRAEACMKAVESLHNSAVNARKTLRPKSWEQAAMVQLRCAEALRHWSLQEEAQANSTRAAGEANRPPPIPTDDVMSEEQWQELAHIALSNRQGSKEGPPGAA